MAKRNRSFHWRGFTSLALTIAFTMMAFSGIILYLTPKGRVANWSGWTMLGLSKEQWAGLHTTCSIFLLVAAGFHLYFNWRPFLFYLKRKAARSIHLKWELAASVALGVFFFGGTLKGIPPFGTILDFGESVKDYWERQSPRAPQAHAEELTLVQFAREMDVPLDTAIQRLEDRGWSIPSGDMPMKDLAELNRVTPNDLGLAVRSDLERGLGNRRGQRGESGGLGRTTLEETCELEQLDLTRAMGRLKSLGIAARPSDSMRSLAERAEMSPRDLMDYIRKE